MTLLSILLVYKTGKVDAANIKEFSQEDLFKRAGFKSSTDFRERTVFQSPTKNVHVFGKITGRAGQENKYEFPPPIDKTLFFGTVLLVAKGKDHEPVGLSVEEWDTMYDALMGGFVDLGTEDTSTEEEEEEEEDDGRSKTKDGFVKDGFVVDDDDEEEEEEEEVKPTKKRSATKKTTELAATDATQLECSQELSEEEYEA
jgi:hypothetical protein